MLAKVSCVASSARPRSPIRRNAIPSTERGVAAVELLERRLVAGGDLGEQLCVGSSVGCHAADALVYPREGKWILAATAASHPDYGR